MNVFKVIITIVVIISFLSESTLVYAIPGSIEFQPSTINYQPSTDFYIPSYYGEIVHKGSSTPDVIIISDAHCNYEAQKNIVGILKILLNQYGVGFIGVEGGSGIVDVSRFSRFKDEKKKEEVLDRFVKGGYVTGPEFLKVVKGEGVPLELYGLEDVPLYKANFTSLKGCLKKGDEWGKVVSKAKEVIRRLKLKIYNPILKGFDEVVDKYWKGEILFTDFVEEIRKKYSGCLEKGGFKNLELVMDCIEIEEKINFNGVEKEREGLLEGLMSSLVKEDIQELTKKGLEYRLGKIGSKEYYGYISQYSDFTDTPNLKMYVELVNKYDEVDKDELFSEIEQAIEKIYDVLGKTGGEKELIRINKDLFILNKAVHLRLSAREYQYYKEGLNRDLLKRIKELGEIQTSAEGGWHPGLDLLNVDNFYSYAEQRDSVLLENLLIYKGNSRAVLMTGGFHTDGITRLLDQKGISYAVIRPRITDASKDSIYFTLLKETIGNENLALTPLVDPENRTTRVIEELRRLAGEVTDRIVMELEGKAFDREEILKYLVENWHRFPESVQEIFKKEFGKELTPPLEKTEKQDSTISKLSPDGNIQQGGGSGEWFKSLLTQNKGAGLLPLLVAICALGLGISVFIFTFAATLGFLPDGATVFSFDIVKLLPSLGALLGGFAIGWWVLKQIKYGAQLWKKEPAYDLLSRVVPPLKEKPKKLIKFVEYDDKEITGNPIEAISLGVELNDEEKKKLTELSAIKDDACRYMLYYGAEENKGLNWFAGIVTIRKRGQGVISVEVEWTRHEGKRQLSEEFVITKLANRNPEGIIFHSADIDPEIMDRVLPNHTIADKKESTRRFKEEVFKRLNIDDQGQYTFFAIERQDLERRRFYFGSFRFSSMWKMAQMDSWISRFAGGLFFALVFSSIFAHAEDLKVLSSYDYYEEYLNLVLTVIVTPLAARSITKLIRLRWDPVRARHKWGENIWLSVTQNMRMGWRMIGVFKLLAYSRMFLSVIGVLLIPAIGVAILGIGSPYIYLGLMFLKLVTEHIILEYEQSYYREVAEVTIMFNEAAKREGYAENFRNIESYSEVFSELISASGLLIGYGISKSSLLTPATIPLAILAAIAIPIASYLIPSRGRDYKNYLKIWGRGFASVGAGKRLLADGVIMKTNPENSLIGRPKPAPVTGWFHILPWVEQLGVTIKCTQGNRPDFEIKNPKGFFGGFRAKKGMCVLMWPQQNLKIELVSREGPVDSKAVVIEDTPDGGCLVRFYPKKDGQKPVKQIPTNIPQGSNQKKGDPKGPELQGSHSCPVNRNTPYYSDDIEVNGVVLDDPRKEVRRAQEAVELYKQDGDLYKVQQIEVNGVLDSYRVIGFKGKYFVVRENLLKELGYSEQEFLARLLSALAREKQIGHEFSFNSIPEVLPIEEMTASPYLGANCTGDGWVGINRAIYDIKDTRVRDLLFEALLMHELWHEANPGKEIESFLEKHDGRFISIGIHDNPILTQIYFYKAARDILAVDNRLLYIMEKGKKFLVKRLINDLADPDQDVRADTARRLILLGKKNNSGTGMPFKGGRRDVEDGENIKMIINHLNSGGNPKSLVPEDHPVRKLLENNRGLFEEYVERKKEILKKIDSEYQEKQLEVLKDGFFKSLAKEFDGLESFSLTIPELIGLWSLVLDIMSLKTCESDYDYCVTDRYKLARMLVIGYLLKYINYKGLISDFYNSLFSESGDFIKFINSGEEKSLLFLRKFNDNMNRIIGSLSMIYQGVKSKFTEEIAENYNNALCVLKSLIDSSLLKKKYYMETGMPLEGYSGEVEEILRMYEVIKKIYPELKESIMAEYPDWEPISIEALWSILITGELPKEWMDPVSSMRKVRVITSIGEILEEITLGMNLTPQTKALIINAIAVQILTDKKDSLLGKIRADLENLGYGPKADEIIGKFRQIKGKKEMSQVDYDFILALEEFLGYEKGTISTKMHISQLKGEASSGVEKLLGIIKSNLTQWQILESAKDKKFKGVIAQDIKDLGLGVKNWEEGLRRYNITGITMAYLVDGISEEDMKNIRSNKPLNAVLINSLEEIEEGPIVYLARGERLERHKDSGIKLVERGNAGPVLELSLCLLLLEDDDYTGFLEKLRELDLVTKDEIEKVVEEIKKLGYIKLPKIEKVLQMWNELEEGISYLEVWA